MRVSDLGEFGLIELLAQIVERSSRRGKRSPGLLLGIGDDAAVWHAEKSAQILTTDILVQDVHFLLSAITWEELGWKAMAVNISDIAAMGGIPRYAVASIALPHQTDVECVTDLYKGMLDASRQYGVSLVGGDTVSSPLVVICVALMGEASREDIFPANVLTRSAAKAGQALAVTGHLGASAGGLRMFKGGLRLDAETASFLRKAHNRPKPRVAEGQMLLKLGVRAAMDLSDGLMADLPKLCKASGVGARVNIDAIPIHPKLHAAFGKDFMELALSGGEDYELLFAADHKLIERARSAISTPITVIGEIVEDAPGRVTLLDSRGEPMAWDKPGWEFFTRRTTA